jgi:hypothetical protein
MNWVEKKAATERNLSQDGLGIWNEVRSAIQDACESWKEHYAPSGSQGPTITLENGTRMRVEPPRIIWMKATLPPFHDPTRLEYVLIYLDKDVPAIKWTDDTGGHEVKIMADENKAFLSGNITADDLSKRILEHLLFQRP